MKVEDKMPMSEVSYAPGLSTLLFVITHMCSSQSRGSCCDKQIFRVLDGQNGTGLCQGLHAVSQGNVRNH